MPRKAKPKKPSTVGGVLMKDVERQLTVLARVAPPPGGFTRHTIESATDDAQPLVRAALAEAKADRDARRRVLKALAKQTATLPDVIDADLERLLKPGSRTDG